MVKNTFKSRLGLLSLALVVIGAAIVSCSDTHSQTFTTYSPVQVSTFLKQDTSAVILDVRTQEEYASESGHLRNSRLIPVQELESRIKELDAVKKKTIITYCRSGHRSKQASEILAKTGFKVINMDGGIIAWNANGLPTEKGIGK